MDHYIKVFEGFVCFLFMYLFIVCFFTKTEQFCPNGLVPAYNPRCCFNSHYISNWSKLCTVLDIITFQNCNVLLKLSATTHGYKHFIYSSYGYEIDTILLVKL